jgi:protein TonB
VVRDPGHGFGRAARQCAMQKRYNTAQDRDGTSIAGQTKPFNVRFNR